LGLLQNGWMYFQYGHCVYMLQLICNVSDCKM